jgi:DNA-binding NtrC family response regulator
VGFNKKIHRNDESKLKNIPLDSSILHFLGASKEINLIRDTLNQMIAIGVNETVLIQGEVGVGKINLAKVIIKTVFGRDDYVIVPCGALKGKYLENEIFGGYQTKKKPRKGRIDQLKDGVLLLTEIGKSHKRFQTRLFDAISNSYFFDNFHEKVPFDITLLFTTSYNLEDMVEAGKFSPELSRILLRNSIMIPPLRRRPEDIEFIAQKLIAELNRITNQQIQMDQKFIDFITELKFKGNINELYDRLKFAYYKNKSGTLEIDDFNQSTASGNAKEYSEYNIRSAVETLEKEMLLKAYALCDGNQVHIAKLLGISRGSLQYKFQKLGIKD